MTIKTITRLRDMWSLIEQGCCSFIKISRETAGLELVAVGLIMPIGPNGVVVKCDEDSATAVFNCDGQHFLVIGPAEHVFGHAV